MNNMFLYSIIRCSIFYLLFSTSFVTGCNDMFNGCNYRENQASEPVIDIYDISMGFGSQKFESVGDTSENVSTKETASESIIKQTEAKTCPPTHTTKYRTVLTAYRSVIGDWIDKLPSKDAQEILLTINLSPSEFDQLKRFASSSDYEQEDVLRDIYDVSDYLKRHAYIREDDKLTYTGLTWSAWIRSFDVNTIVNGFFVLVITVVLTIITASIYTRRGGWLVSLLIVAFPISVIQNWYTLYQEAQAKINLELMKEIPKYCQGQSMGFFDQVKTFASNIFQSPTDPCLEYQKAMRATPHSQATLAQAVSMTIAQFFITPLGAIGEGISKFFAGIMRHIPIIFLPFIIGIVVILILILILAYFRYELHLPLWLGALRPTQHAAVAATTNNQEERLNQISNYVTNLENEVKQLRLEKEQKTNLQLEHNTTSSLRTGRSSSEVRKTKHRRQRSLCTQQLSSSSDEADNEL